MGIKDITENVLQSMVQVSESNGLKLDYSTQSRDSDVQFITKIARIADAVQVTL